MLKRLVGRARFTYLSISSTPRSHIGRPKQLKGIQTSVIQDTSRLLLRQASLKRGKGRLPPKTAGNNYVFCSCTSCFIHHNLYVLYDSNFKFWIKICKCVENMQNRRYVHILIREERAEIQTHFYQTKQRLSQKWGKFSIPRIKVVYLIDYLRLLDELHLWTSFAVPFGWFY